MSALFMLPRLAQRALHRAPLSASRAAGACARAGAAVPARWSSQLPAVRKAPTFPPPLRLLPNRPPLTTP